MSIDVKAERAAFETWWRMWCPDRDMPSTASHIFDAWLASARNSAAMTQPLPEPPLYYEMGSEGSAMPTAPAVAASPSSHSVSRPFGLPSVSQEKK